MKRIFLPAFLLLSGFCFAQLPDSGWLNDYSIDTISLKVLRAPADQITVRFKNDIISIQKQLDRCKAEYEAGKQTYKSSLESDIQFISVQVPEWPSAYYQKELIAYMTYNKAWKARQTAMFYANVKREQDSIRIAKLVDGHCFVSAETTTMTERPYGKGMAIATFYKGSYLKLEGYIDTGSYIHVSAFAMDGYVRKSDIVEQLEKLDVDAAKMEKLKNIQYFNYTKTDAYLARERKEEAAEAAEEAREARGNRTVYHKGPKGGCYIITSNNKKEYVDKSNCWSK